MAEVEEAAKKKGQGNVNVGKVLTVVAGVIVAAVAVISLVISVVQNSRILEIEERLFITDVKLLGSQSSASATMSIFDISVDGEAITRELELMGIQPDYSPPKNNPSKEAIISGSVELWVANEGARPASVVSIGLTAKLEPLNTLVASDVLESLNNPELAGELRPQFAVSVSEPTNDQGDPLPVRILDNDTKVFRISFELTETSTYRDVYDVLRKRYGGPELTHPTHIILTPNLQLQNGQFVTGDPLRVPIEELIVEQ